MNKKLLAIDDNSGIRYLLEFVLKDDFEVKSLKNGLDALSYMQRGNVPDVIICDLEMPVMGGMEFINNIRSSAFFASIPVIVLSANEDSSERIKCLNNGADDYLVKPFNPEELKSRVSNLFSRAQKLV
jgi:DNA-binding response OmpR family regulator